MRNFLSSLLGSLAAMVVFAAGAVILLIGILAVVGSMGEKKVPVEQGSYLVFDLSANITDAPPRFDFASITGDKTEVIQLRAATKAIRAAATDNRIKGMMLVGSLSPQGLGTGYAALSEVRAALLDFKAQGKPIKAFLTYTSTHDYFLASVADDIALDPYGVLVIPGLASESVFFAQALKKYGIGVQVTRVGKYKGAVEPFTREDLSPENREQLQKLLDDVWGGILTEVSVSRKIDTAELQKIVDREGMIRADVAKTAGLVDRVIYRDVILDELKEATGRKGDKEAFKQIALSDYANLVPVHAGNASERVAVVYAEGEIVDGEGDWGQIGGDKFARELRRLRQDNRVKAIVLRVNSPGGSATASETIQREMRLAGKVKPVVVSMGSYAASGGYWISTFSHRIFAEPTTITGSIGVFGLMVNINQLAGDHGITFDRVKTGKFADAMTISRPKTDDELAVIQRSVDWIYDQFLDKVTDSRKLDRKFVEEIAQGRVWSGVEAKELGLVDEMGGLEDAITYAAQAAKLGTSFQVSEFPRKKELSEVITEMLDRVRPAGVKLGVYGELVKRVEGELISLRAYNDPQGIYARLPVSINLQ